MADVDSRYIAFENDHTYLKTTNNNNKDVKYFHSEITGIISENNVVLPKSLITKDHKYNVNSNEILSRTVNALNVSDSIVYYCPAVHTLDSSLTSNIKQNNYLVQNVDLGNKANSRPILPKLTMRVIPVTQSNASSNIQSQNLVSKKPFVKLKLPNDTQEKPTIKSVKPMKNKVVKDYKKGICTIKLSYNLFKQIQSGGKLFMCMECDQIYMEHKELLDHQLMHEQCNTHIIAQGKQSINTVNVERIVTENEKEILSEDSLIQQTKPIFESSVNSRKRKTIFMGECIKCHSVFQDLAEHIKTVHKNDLNKHTFHHCNKCVMEFDTQQQLRAHEMSAHKINYPHACEHCFQEFTYEEDLEIHSKSHIHDHMNYSQNKDKKFSHNSNYMKYLCPYCDAGFPHSVGLRIHLNKHIGSNSTEIPVIEIPTNQIEYSPTRPLEQFDKLFTEINHVTENVDGVYINQGNNDYYQFMFLKQEQESELPSDSFIDEDPKNDLELDEDSKMNIELNELPLKTNEDDKMLNQQQTTLSTKKRVCYTVCRICMIIVCYSKIGKHMKKKHNNAPPYKCEICRAVFYRKHIMDDHRRKHTNSKPHKCLECSKCFTYKHHLNRHMMIVHNADTIEKPFKCSVCDKAFSFKEYLTLHVNSRHSGKHYMCQVCGKSFSTNAALNKHQLSHTEERPFMCEHCGRTFKCKTHCDTHKKNMHPGDPHLALPPEKFECNLCHKKFSTKVYRDMHFKRHNGQGHPCDICYKLFVSKAHMQRHKKIMHRN